MAKKRNKPVNRASAKAAATQSPEVREREALQALEAGRYREAITAIKALLKEDAASERSAARRLALAEAYAGRAHELTEKGMLKEALVIWENRAALGPEVPPALEHGLLCLRLGNLEPVIKHWSHREALTPAERERIGEQLAAAVLAGDQQLLARLDADDLIRRHAEPARTALQAYCAKDAEALEAALAQIPFRSPYRAWATLLKALVRAEHEPEAARAMLERIGDDSAFAPLRRAAKLALLDDAGFIRALEHAGPQQAAFAAELRGWSPQQLELAQALATLGTKPKPAKSADQPTPNRHAMDHQGLLRLLKRYRDLLGADWVQQASLRLLPPISEPWGPRPKGWRELTDLEQALVEAWSAEDPQGGFGWDPLEAWEAVAEALSDPHCTGAGLAAQDRLFAAALALRRFDAHYKLLETDPSKGPVDTDPDSGEAIAAEQLERSLAFDPDHRETYLRLISWYRRADRLKDARRILSAAQGRWPRDMAVLEAAMQTALASNAFKKAAGLAQQMLKVDPINTGVRQQLVKAHLQHAAKQIRNRRGDLALKEVGEARNWVARGAGQDPLRERLTWIDDVLAMHYVDRDAARGRLLERLQQRGEGLAGRVELMVAIDELAVSQAQVAKLLELKSEKVRNAADLRAIIAHLRQFLDQTERFTKGLSDQLKVMLKGAPWKQLERSELEVACEPLRRMRLHAARQEAARAALKRWPRTPIFEFHLYHSQYADQGHPKPKELERMREALQRAEEAGDMRVANQLRELVRQFLPFGGLPMPSFDPDFDPDLDPDWDEGAPDQMAALLTGALGLDKLLDALKRKPLRQALEESSMPGVLRAHFLEMAEEEGEESVVEMLEAIVLSAVDSLDGLPLPNSGSGSKQRKRKSKKFPFNLDLF